MIDTSDNVSQLLKELKRLIAPMMVTKQGTKNFSNLMYINEALYRLELSYDRIDRELLYRALLQIKAILY